MKKILITISMFLMLLFSVMAVSAVVVNVPSDTTIRDGASNPRHSSNLQHNINYSFNLVNKEFNLSSCTIVALEKSLNDDYNISNPRIETTLDSNGVNFTNKVVGFRIPENLDTIYVDNTENVVAQDVAKVHCVATGTIETISIRRDAKLIIDRIEASFADSTSRFRRSGDEIKNIKPGTVMNLEVFLRNDFHRDANNEIDVEVTIECSPDDIYMDDDVDDIRLYEAERASVFFVLDFDEDDVTDTRYSCRVIASGRDDNKAFHSAEWEIRFDVEKERYAIDVRDLRISPDRITCESREVTISTLIRNIGSRNDRNVKLEITVPQLNFKQEFSDLDMFENDEFRRTTSVLFPEDIRPGTYQIIARAFSRGTVETGSKTLSVTVPNCNDDEEEEDVLDVVAIWLPVQGTCTRFLVQEDSLKGTEYMSQQACQASLQDTTDEPVVEEEEEESNNIMLIVLIVVIVLLIAGIAGLLIYLFKP